MSSSLKCFIALAAFFHYEKVQPVGVLSLSCNWVILHKEIDQLLVKIQSNPAGIVVC